MFKIWPQGLLLLVLALLPLLAAAQTDDTYEPGLRYLAQKRYHEAASAFKQLLPASHTGISKHGPKVDYYYALAELKNGNLAMARSTLQSLLTKGVDASLTREARYLLGNVLLEERKYTQAAAQLVRLANSPLQSKADNMKQNYLRRPEVPLDTLRELARPGNDRVLAAIYIDKLVAQGTATGADEQLAKNLASRHNLSAGGIKASSLPSGQGYKVAVLLPFNTSEANLKSSSRKDQIPLDLYSGIVKAVEELNAAGNGTPIELFVYNTDRNEQKIAQILALPELKGMQLIIGPLYSNGAEQVAQFAEANGIVLVNPLGNKFIWEDGKQFAFHAEPVAYTRGYESAKWFGTNGVNRAMVFFGPEAADSLLAAGFLAGAKEANIKVLRQRKMLPGKGPALTGEYKTNSADSTMVVLVASDASSTVVNVLGQAKQAGVRPHFLAYEDVMTTGRFNLGDLAEQRVFVIAPYYCNTYSQEAYTFRHEYAKRFNISPSVYATKGYDLMAYLGKRLQESGGNLMPALRADQKHGAKFCGSYVFKQAQDNQHVPLYRLEAAGPVGVN